MADWKLLKSVGSYPGVPNIENHSLKSTEITSNCEQVKSRKVSLCHRWTAGDAERRLKGQHINVILQPLTLGSGKLGAQSGLEMIEGILGTEALGRELRE